MKTAISFRLRKELDSDLISAIENLDRQNLNNLCRDGLRLMLGIRTAKSTTIIERPLLVPAPLQNSMSKTIVSPASVYIPKRSD